MDALFGARAGAIMSGLAFLVVLAGVNANIFVTPRVVFGLSREGLAPRVFARVSAGGTPWTALLLVGAVSMALAATGTFERLLAFAIQLVLLTDGFMVLVLFRLRRRRAQAPFRVPFYPLLPAAFLALYAVLFVVAARAQPVLACVTLGILALAYAIGAVSVRRSLILPP
jgi:APA family basic amino acid/polyamine antiporter